MPGAERVPPDIPAGHEPGCSDLDTVGISPELRGRDVRDSLWETCWTLPRSGRIGLDSLAGRISVRMGPQGVAGARILGATCALGVVELGRRFSVRRGSQAATCGGDCCRSIARCQVWRAQAFWASAAMSTMTVWLCKPHAGSRRCRRRVRTARSVTRCQHVSRRRGSSRDQSAGGRAGSRCG